jgi:photosystem II stability/assembly factor-like uncharacterized protein
MKKLIHFLLTIIIIALFIINAEAQWLQLNSGTNYKLMSFFSTDANTVYFAGLDSTFRNTIHKKSTNGGLNWFQLNINQNIGGFCVYFTNANTGFVGGWPSLLMTTNAGNNWTAVYSSTDTIIIWSIHFPNTTTGYGVGNIVNNQLQILQSVVLKTTNGGNNWAQLAPPVSGNGKEPHSVFFTDANTGYIAGWANGGLFLKTTNGGNNWSNITTNPNLVDLEKVLFVDANTGYLCGNYNITINSSAIFKTTNAGANWFSSYIYPDSISGDMYSMYFANANTGYAVGNNRIIVKTTNAGSNWFMQNAGLAGLNKALVSVMFYDVNTGYTVGDSGKILKTTNGGSVFISQIGNNIPEKFLLYQNNPNPFNPSTNIRYDLWKNGFVKLVVFDVLGHEIETLVNENQSAGTYEATFSANNYSSGIYFYKLSTENFSDVKKMILLK